MNPQNKARLMRLRLVMLAQVLLLLPAAGAPPDTLGAVTTKPGATLVAAFIEALLANVSTGAIMDVGANNGAWARDTLRACRGRGAATPSLLLVEPQTEFHPVLAKLAKTWGGTLLPKAAWVRDEQLVFHLSSNSESASVQESMARVGGGLASAEQTEVPAVDIAREIKLALRGVQGPVLLKIESARLLKPTALAP